MTDLLTILIALIIIIAVVGFFGFLATKINMSDPLSQIETNQSIETKRKEKHTNDQSRKKRKEQKKPKRENKDDEEKQQQQRNKSSQANEETDDEREESELEQVNAPVQTTEALSKARKRNKNKAVSNESNAPTRVPPATYPKSASKNETDFSKQQTKVQPTGKQSATKKTTTAQPVEKSSQVQEQPFTVVGGNRHKNSTAQTQQNKTQVNTVVPTAQAQHEQLPQRQQQPLPVKETPVPAKQTPATTVSAPVKQTPASTTSVPAKQTPVAAPKIADLIKVLPSSQAVVTELMSALDAFPLSTDELDIIMHKIANKQSVVKQDWSKLQQGQKVDPQAHIGQVLDESARAYQDDMKTNALIRVKELTDELNEEKRRNNDLLKEKTNKDREIQILHAQFDSLHQKNPSVQSQQKLHTLELQVQRLTEENLRLTQQQQQSIPTSDSSSNVQLQVLSEQIRKLSVDNANLEKKLHSHELLVRESQKEKDDLIRYNEQLTQTLRKAEKDLQTIENNHHQQLNETRTLTLNELNEYKHRIQQLETENEQLKREEIVHVESPPTDIQTITINSEEREQLEKEIQEYKQTIENLQLQEKNFKQEIQRLKQIDWTDVKSQFSQILPENLRSQLSNDNQDFNQWLAFYRQLSETNQRNLQEELSSLRNEKEQLQKNMTDIENQLKDIEKTVQTKEESLLNELKNKDSLLENLNQEIQRLQAAHDASVSEIRSLKAQLDERSLAATANTPSIITVDESFEFVKQPTPSLSPIVVDVRAEQLNELIRSSKQALENQETLTQQLDKHLDDMQETELGETSAETTSTDQ